EQGAGKIEALSIPTLGNHVELFADLFLVDLLRLLRVRYVKHTHFTVAETVYEQRFVVVADANIHWQHAARWSNLRDVLALPFALVVLVTKPEFGGQSGGGEG